MKSTQAEKIIGKINLAIKDINSFSNISDLEKSYLAKFLIVFICGIYEEVIEVIINEKADKCNDSEIINYIKKSLDQTFRNPDMGNIKGLLGKFSVSWKSEIEKLPLSTQTAMDNIVNDKNSLSHGSDIILTLQEVTQYYNDSLIVINKIDNMLL